MEENPLSVEEQDQLNHSIKKARTARIRHRIGEDNQDFPLKDCSGSLLDGGKRKFSYHEMVLGDTSEDLEMGVENLLEDDLSDEEVESHPLDDVKFLK